MKIKNIIVNSLYSAGVGLGMYAALFRTVEVITYSEFKGAALLALGLCGAAFAIAKLKLSK
jgi:hypothetical protein